MTPPVRARAVHIIVLRFYLPVHIHTGSENISIYLIFPNWLFIVTYDKKKSRGTLIGQLMIENFNVLGVETSYLRIFLQFQCLLINIFTFIWDNDPRIYRARLLSGLYAEPKFRQNKEKTERKIDSLYKLYLRGMIT